VRIHRIAEKKHNTAPNAYHITLFEFSNGLRVSIYIQLAGVLQWPASVSATLELKNKKQHIYSHN
jgi:hypothetical protein